MELWSVESGKLISFIPDLEGINSSPFVISPDNKWLILGDKKGKINFWSIEKKKIIMREEISKEVINKMRFFDKDKLLIASGKKIYLRNINEAKNIKVFNVKSSPIHQIVSSPNKKSFLTLSQDSLLNIWTIHQDKPLYSLDIKNTYADMGKVVDFSSNAKEVIIGYEDGSLKLYSTDNLKEPKKIFVFGDKKNWVVFDEEKKKMTIADEGSFLLKKQQVYKDENVTIFEFERYEK